MTDIPLTARVTRHVDYAHLQGGLARMMNRFKEEGSMIGDPEADMFIATHPNAALLGLLYDQRVRAEYAFTGPIRLYERLGHLDMAKIAAYPEDEFKEVFGAPLAVHRFTNKMADVTQAVAKVVAETYSGDSGAIWADDVSFSEIKKRVKALPGFGPLKAEKMRYVLHYFGYRDFADE